MIDSCCITLGMYILCLYYNYIPLLIGLEMYICIYVCVYVRAWLQFISCNSQSQRLYAYNYNDYQSVGLQILMNRSEKMIQCTRV